VRIELYYYDNDMVIYSKLELAKERQLEVKTKQLPKDLPPLSLAVQQQKPITELFAFDNSELEQQLKRLSQVVEVKLSIYLSTHICRLDAFHRSKCQKQRHPKSRRY
jgi:hypothetical protein